MTHISGNVPEEILDELESVIGDIHGFLHGFCARLERLAVTLPAQRETVVDPACDDDEDENWETNRVQVERKLRDQVDLLADAWLRLEAEQRELLLLKKGNAVDSFQRATTDRLGTPDTGLPSLPGSLRLSRQSQHSAVVDFERLRQEIQFNRPQPNVK